MMLHTTCVRLILHMNLLLHFIEFFCFIFVVIFIICTCEKEIAEKERLITNGRKKNGEFDFKVILKDCNTYPNIHL